MAKRGVQRSPGYITGSHWAVCDSCGFQFRSEDLTETWDKLWVCDEDFETRHPQEFLRVKEEHGYVDQPIRPEDTSNTVIIGFGSDSAVVGLALVGKAIVGKTSEATKDMIAGVPSGTFNTTTL